MNALSKRVDITIRRDGNIYSMAFENGDKVEDLAITGQCGKRNTGTGIRFLPDESFLIVQTLQCHDSFTPCAQKRSYARATRHVAR